GDLAKAIHSNRLSLDQKLGILREVALALDHAHNLGIVHRDLKPSNILLDHGLRPRICDFGISISRDNDPALDKTGAVGFLAPELLNGANPCVASDMWSLGVVLFETLTKELPFDCPSTG
ncbi:MAG: protein kinase domain-containing protein, partial [Planctomycetia bacterium]